MIKESYGLIRHKYEAGVYSLKQMIEFTEKKVITEEEFHWITGYSYRGLKKCGIGK